jgi:S-adenosylmethionine decarboxylase
LMRLLYQLPKTFGAQMIARPELINAGPVNMPEAASLCGHVTTSKHHITFHTFPARRLVTLDFYAPDKDVEASRVIKTLKRAFALRDADVFVNGAAQTPRKGPSFASSSILAVAE